jgi:hypothetical protein
VGRHYLNLHFVIAHAPRARSADSAFKLGSSVATAFGLTMASAAAQQCGKPRVGEMVGIASRSEAQKPNVLPGIEHFAGSTAIRPSG